MKSQDLKKYNLPDEPGVYIFKQGSKILYIGKATSLNDRVKSYFASDLLLTRGPVIIDMINKADKIDFIQTDSVIEALILETELIKKYKPDHNTKDKDDKSYNYIVITSEKFPRILLERKKNIDFINKKINGIKIKKFFGPYIFGMQIKEALRIIRKIFPFRDSYCEPENPKHKPCFNYQIGLCPGCCIGVVTKEEYAKTIRNISNFFSGNKRKIIKDLEKEMNVSAKMQDFEKADKIKKTIFALTHIQDIALIRSMYEEKNLDLEKDGVVSGKSIRIEAYDVAHISGEANVGVMVVVKDGIPDGSEYRKFKINKSKQNDILALKEILERRLTHEEWKLPDIIVVDGGQAQINVATEVVAHLFEGSEQQIQVVSVVKDERHKARQILGDQNLASKFESEIILANKEAHRFAIKYHRERLSKRSLS